MILVPPMALFPKVLAHKECGSYVERMPFLPGWYSCPKCSAILHANNVEQVDLPQVS